MLTPSRLRCSSVLLGTTLLVSFAMAGFATANDATDDSEDMSTLNSMSVDDLQQLRGREGINLTNVQSIQDLKSTVRDSSINAGSVTSGPITIESNALDHFGGVGLFNIMTGNNNAVGTAVGISINLSNE